MAKEKKMVEAITSMEEDFAQWYTDIVKKAELVEYSGIKGCMVIRPSGYAIWELIQKELDRRFKETGVENVYMPMFIPESLLNKEKDHVEGFAPDFIRAGHLIVKLSSGDYAPMPVNGDAYASLPGGAAYAGYLVASIPTKQPLAAIMVRGTINPKASPYPLTTIMEDVKEALPLIDYQED